MVSRRAGVAGFVDRRRKREERDSARPRGCARSAFEGRMAFRRHFWASSGASSLILRIRTMRGETTCSRSSSV